MRASGFESWVCVAALLAACGDSGDDAQKNPDTSAQLDRSAPIDDLDTVGTALCTALDKLELANPEFIDRTCMSQAVIWSQDGSSCMDKYEACLDDPLHNQKLHCDPNLKARDFGCPKLTVGMFLDCTKERQTRYAERNQFLTCETTLDDLLGDSFLGGYEDTHHPTPACKKALAVCPSVLD